MPGGRIAAVCFKPRWLHEYEFATHNVEQTKILQRLHEIAVEDAARIFIVHDLNPRALSPRVIGFVQARSWYQDLTPIVVTSPPN